MREMMLGIGLFLGTSATMHAAESADTRCYELRVYTAPEGKLEALHARFRDHTCKLFEKHGMTNVGYWVPLENPENKLYYVLSYPTREARNKSWSAFMADPEWRAAYVASEKEGKLTSKVESRFLQATDFSPAIAPGPGKEPRIFELRTYTCTPGNLDRLLSRFRDHTCALFAKHGMTNWAYWTLEKGQPGAEETLIYLLAHPSQEACTASFAAFREDPDWQKAKAASEAAAGGSLTTPDGVKSLFLTPTDYSRTK
ncbi:MAG: NIPSNAP family protein [Pirellulales bacterium]|nr:NIPSNAP family protein [Pirellulales bacterium]